MLPFPLKITNNCETRMYQYTTRSYRIILSSMELPVLLKLQEKHFIIQCTCSTIIILTWLIINIFGIFPLCFLLFRNTMTTVEFAAIPTLAIKLWRITITSDVDSLSSVEELFLMPLHSWQIDESLKMLEVVLSIFMRIYLTGNSFEVVQQLNSQCFSPLALKVSEKM